MKQKPRSCFANSRFVQQQLPACRPVLTPAKSIAIFCFVGVLCIVIGLASLLASRQVVEIVRRYDDICIPPDFTLKKEEYIRNSDTNKTCEQILEVSWNMTKPVYVYYQIENYHQNHRRYVKSRNYQQIMGKQFESKIRSCGPENGTLKNPIVPCGLIAWSLFNDTFSFLVNGNGFQLNKNIAWKSDKEGKYGSDVYPKNFQNGTIIGGAKLDSRKPLSEQEDLMVWMRLAALPTFRKLYGIIDQDLKVGDLVKVVIGNHYNTYSFAGKKSLVLSTTTWIGGKNDFLGIAYLTVGGVSLCLAIFFTVLVTVVKRRDRHS